MADVIIVAIAYLDYLSPSLTLCGSFASVSSSWRVCRKVLTLMCSWSAFPCTACGTWWISINIPPFLWLRLWRVMQSRIVIPRPPSSPWLLRRCVAIWIRILNSSEHTSSPSLQRKSTLRCSIVSPKWISLFGGFVLALSFLRVALPGGPLRSSAIICDFCGIPGHTSFRCFRRMSIQRAGRGRFSPHSRAPRGRGSFQ